MDRRLGNLLEGDRFYMIRVTQGITDVEIEPEMATMEPTVASSILNFVQTVKLVELADLYRRCLSGS